jgi:hypothetical protein
MVGLCVIACKLFLPEKARAPTLKKLGLFIFIYREVTKVISTGALEASVSQFDSGLSDAYETVARS